MYTETKGTINITRKVVISDRDDKTKENSYNLCPAPVVSALLLISYWIEPEKSKKQITVYLVLPLAIGSSQFSPRVEEGRHEIILIVKWPTNLWI